MTERRIEIIDNDNCNNDAFFFLFTPKTVDTECCCCGSLKTGMKFFSVIFLLASTSSFMTAIKNISPVIIVISIVMSILYLICAFYTFIAAVNLNLQYTQIAYVIYEIIILFNIIEDIGASILISLGYLNPFTSIDQSGYLDTLFVFVIFILVNALILLIAIYILWLIFSFMVHIKNNRLRVVVGENIIKDEILKEEETPINNNDRQ